MLVLLLIVGAALTILEIYTDHPQQEQKDLEINNQFPTQQQDMQQHLKNFLKDQANTIIANRLQQPNEVKKILDQQANQLKTLHNQNPNDY